jgi:hypothetical protein
MTLGPHTITVVRPVGVKPADYGTGTEPDWSAATSTPVGGCSVQPTPAPAYTIDQDSYQSRWTVWAPISTEVASGDRVVWDGQTYDVDGEVMTWEFGRLSHLVINLRRSAEA